MEERRLIIAVALSIAVLVGWPLIFKPKPRPPSVKPPSQQQAVQQPETPQATPEVGVGPAPVPPQQQLVGGSLSPTFQTPPTDVSVETDLYTCVISTSGGYLKSFKLKKFRESADKDSPPKELVGQDLPDNRKPLLLSLNLGGKTLPASAVFTPSESSVTASGEAARTLKLTLQTSEGYTIERGYTFTGGDYTIGLDVKVTAEPPSTIEGKIAGPANEYLAINWSTRIDPKSAKSRFLPYAVVTFVGKSFEKDDVEEVYKNQPVKYEAPLWMGFVDSYFLNVIIPEGQTREMRTEIEGEEKSGILTQAIEFAPGVVSPGKSTSFKATVYIGPKDYNRLQAFGENLKIENAVEYGKYLGPIVRLLLWFLITFNKLVHNWGLSIVLLTVFVKLVFYPLTLSSYKQMKALQALQPRVKELQEKYKNDRQKLNEEMMGLYRTQKVNPLGGCLPMLLQLPVLYALYRALYVSVDLRHAAFIGWINDLSSPEALLSLPLFGGVELGVMPLLMGASMFVQQKMTPTTMDPMQAKMFMMMPLVFTVISFGFPSGLVLYWTVSNVLTIAQQYVINRRGR